MEEKKAEKKSGQEDGKEKKDNSKNVKTQKEPQENKGKIKFNYQKNDVKKYAFDKFRKNNNKININ